MAADPILLKAVRQDDAAWANVRDSRVNVFHRIRLGRELANSLGFLALR